MPTRAASRICFSAKIPEFRVKNGPVPVPVGDAKEAAKQEQSESLKAISSRFKHGTGISRIVKVCGFLGSFWVRETTVSSGK